MSRPSRRIAWIAWATVALYVLVAVCLTHMPQPPDMIIEEVGDKKLHTAGYFLYAALIYTAAGLTWPRFRGLSLTVVLLLALWAAADEITQPYFGRSADVMDWRADMIGVIAAVVVLALLRFVAARRRTAADQ
ncbi:MAG TPA: VanZ family protein [Tepidisphaeraceae bacterium]|jgi:VanZ family protein